MRAWHVIFVALVVGCDRKSSAPPTPPARAKDLVVEISGVTPLLPDRRTHVAPTGAGQLFWVQEAPEAGGRETVFALADGGLASATKLSNASVLEALKEPGAQGGIQSLAATPDAQVLFYFAGQTRRKLLLALGVFSPARGETRVLADSAALRESSGMGNTLALARGSILRSASATTMAGRTWLWLRHDHGFALLSIEADGTVRRAFDRVQAPAGETLALVSSGEDLAADGEGLVYLERGRGRLWRIGAGGDASVLADVSELPRGMTGPSPDGGGRVAMFAPEGPPLVEPPENPLLAPKPVADFPALVRYTGDKRSILGRGAFDAPSRVNVRALSFPQLVRDRSSWLAYDTQTGELLRVRVGER